MSTLENNIKRICAPDPGKWWYLLQDGNLIANQAPNQVLEVHGNFASGLEFEGSRPVAQRADVLESILTLQPGFKVVQVSYRGEPQPMRTLIQGFHDARFPVDQSILSYGVTWNWDWMREIVLVCENSGELCMNVRVRDENESQTYELDNPYDMTAKSLGFEDDQEIIEKLTVDQVSADPELTTDARSASKVRDFEDVLEAWMAQAHAAYFVKDPGQCLALVRYKLPQLVIPDVSTARVTYEFVKQWTDAQWRDAKDPTIIRKDPLNELTDWENHQVRVRSAIPGFVYELRMDRDKTQIRGTINMGQLGSGKLQSLLEALKFYP